MRFDLRSLPFGVTAVNERLEPIHEECALPQPNVALVLFAGVNLVLGIFSSQGDGLPTLVEA
jgi:hypothetical protein